MRNGWLAIKIKIEEQITIVFVYYKAEIIFL